MHQQSALIDCATYLVCLCKRATCRRINAIPRPTVIVMQNLGFFDITLTPAQMTSLSSRPQDPCAEDPKWYECYNATTVTTRSA